MKKHLSTILCLAVLSIYACEKPNQIPQGKNDESISNSELIAVIKDLQKQIDSLKKEINTLKILNPSTNYFFEVDGIPYGPNGKPIIEPVEEHYKTDYKDWITDNSYTYTYDSYGRLSSCVQDYYNEYKVIDTTKDQYKSTTNYSYEGRTITASTTKVEVYNEYSNTTETSTHKLTY